MFFKLMFLKLMFKVNVQKDVLALFKGRFELNAKLSYL